MVEETKEQRPMKTTPDGYSYPADLEVVDVIDEQFKFSPDAFKIPPRFRDYVDSIILPDGLIMNPWVRLAERILEDFEGEEELHILIMMNGGFRFFEDLKVCLDDQQRFLRGAAIRLTCHFIRVKSYKGMVSSGEL